MHDGAARAAPTPRWIRRRSRAAGCEPIRPATSGPGQAGQCGNPRQASCNTAGCRAEAGGPRGTRLGPVLVAAPCAPRRWTRRWPGTWRHCLAVDLGSRVTVRRRHPGGHPGGQASESGTAPGRPPRRFVGDCGGIAAVARPELPHALRRVSLLRLRQRILDQQQPTPTPRLARSGQSSPHTSCRLGLGGRLEFSWNTADVRRRATKQQVIWGAPPWPRPACAENGPSTLVLLTPEPSRRGDREHAPPPAGSTVLTPIMGGRRCAGSPSTQRPRPDRQRRSQCPTRLGPPTLRRPVGAGASGKYTRRRLPR